MADCGDLSSFRLSSSRGIFDQPSLRETRVMRNHLYSCEGECETEPDVLVRGGIPKVVFLSFFQVILNPSCSILAFSLLLVLPQCLDFWALC